jgi:uncharacterized membrane protein YgdD (TMEM256/DUF423 family)
MNRPLAFLGCLFAFTAVAAGAFGAHALRDRLPADLLAVFETGARYQMFHALALLFAAIVGGARGARVARAAGWLFVTGMVVFPGSLYLLALSGVRAWGAVTPLGGVAFLAGWVLLAWAVARPADGRPEASLRREGVD